MSAKMGAPVIPIEMIADSLVAAILCDPRLPDTPIVACNAQFESLTGYRRDEILGQNCRFLAGPETEPHLTARLREAIAAKRPVIVNLLNYRKDGSAFRNAVMVAPIFDADGELAYFIGSQAEIFAHGEGAGSEIDSTAAQRIAALPPRPRAVLQCLARGQRNKQIVLELGLAERTVKRHRAEALRLLGVATLADAIRLAVQAGL